MNADKVAYRSQNRVRRRLTSMRQLSIRKKPRGVIRRLRSLEQWAAELEGWFPVELTVAECYFNIKIPVLRGIVEGRHARRQWKVRAAQALINACALVVRSKPIDKLPYRVTCTVCVPDLFTSELCIYSSEDYFQSKVAPDDNNLGSIKKINGRSLAEEWGLVLPEGIEELGVVWDFTKSSDADDHYLSEHWVYGEVFKG